MIPFRIKVAIDRFLFPSKWEYYMKAMPKKKIHKGIDENIWYTMAYYDVSKEKRLNKK